ncbi:hypothetical protein [Shewanella nanhaiensis]|uniref:DUF1049 domain-containing protein n=1 Tax=Shewanella nanhaiensis TaxID=2864872 RepID=A0ABS7E517_9GAMM|nr:hypothetical protein [Shewanella nanhaiensis]MBW8184453.1 hypothetical protein [Shewanella nanhaiensis]
MERIGVIISCLWLLIIGSLLALKWSDVINLTLNEWGDFLAGVTAPLAFLWLIIGYGLQRKELKANTEALLFQRNELASQAKELSAQTKHMAESAKAASDQARYTRRKQTQERLAARLAQRESDSSE